MDCFGRVRPRNDGRREGCSLFPIILAPHAHLPCRLAPSCSRHERWCKCQGVQVSKTPFNPFPVSGGFNVSGGFAIRRRQASFSKARRWLSSPACFSQGIHLHCTKRSAVQVSKPPRPPNTGFRRICNPPAVQPVAPRTTLPQSKGRLLEARRWLSSPACFSQGVPKPPRASNPPPVRRPSISSLGGGTDPCHRDQKIVTAQIKHTMSIKNPPMKLIHPWIFISLALFIEYS